MYDIGALDEPMQYRHTCGRLEVDADTALAPVGAHRDVGAVPPRVAQCVDLDHRGTQVAEHLCAERAGDGEAEVDHRDTGERRGVRRHMGRREGHDGRRRAGDGGRFGFHRVAVLPLAGRRALHAPGSLVQAIDEADVAQTAEVGIVDIDDDAFVDQRLVAQRFFGSADLLQRGAVVARDAHPFGAREPLHGRGHLGVVVREDEHVLGIVADPVRVIAHVRDTATRFENVAIGARQHEHRVGHPLLDPPTVGTFEVSLRRATVGDPHTKARGVGILDPHPLAHRQRHRALEQRCLDQLPSSGHLAREQGGIDTRGGQVRGRQRRPRRVGEDRAGSGRARSAAGRHLEVGHRGLDAVDVVDRPAGPTALLEL